MAPAHHWGQNFLVSPSVVEDIADLALSDPSRGRRILEIGPGAGALTLTLLERGAEVLAIELDERFRPLLESWSRRFPQKLSVTYGDALELSWSELASTYGWSNVTVMGNLPYYITAPLLGRLIETHLSWQRAIFMVQREVAARLLTEPGGRQSSALGVLLRYRADVQLDVAEVPPANFYPVPEVFSTVIQLIAHPPLAVPYTTFRWVVRAGFQHRRKTLRQALAQATGSPFSKAEWQMYLEEIGISSSARAEALVLEEWVRLAAAVNQRSERTS